jgi:predicted O-methyltransferase YrrM
MAKTFNIVLAMPGYGHQTQKAGRALWRACRDMNSVLVVQECGSLLAHNFNKLWCVALNRAHAGEPVDYFAMLHDDIGLADGWLDALIDELEANQLDILGVVSPIKDTRGLTSIALHREGDNWRPAARLSLHEIFELPPTFTSDDLGGKQLLLNTGCWVCKFDMSWATKVWFEINDRVGFNSATNQYEALNESEDWFFSRLAHELDLKIGATRKLYVAHEGAMTYTNTRAWGSHAFDAETCDRSLVPGAHPYDIRGWLTPEEGKALAELARGKRVLEIGSYCGLSTVCIARTAQSVTAMDYFDGRGTDELKDTYPDLMASLKRHGVEDKVTTCHPDSDKLPLQEYDLVFIDGAHDYKSVKADIEKAERVLAAGGLIVFHDYREYPGAVDGRWDEGVTKAVRELIAAGYNLTNTTDTLAILSPPAALLLEV